MKTTKKKSFKRLFAFLMAFVMVTALAANAVFAAELSDIADHWAKEHIQNLVDADIIGGYPDGTFKPDNKVTRQEAAKMIALGSGYCEHDGTGSKLVDVADLTWGQENIWALEAADVVNGFGTSKEFRPRLNITRGHVAKMIALAFGLEEGAEEVELKDLPADEKVAEAIRVLASNGIVKGFGTSKEFRPDALVTRGELAKMIDLAMKKSDARVLYVRAINGTTIEVRFSVPVDKDSATASGWNKVKIDGVYIQSRALSDDGRVLTLDVRMGQQQFGNALNVTNATVEVEPVRLEGSTTLRTVRYIGKLTYKDTVAPYVVKVEGKDQSAEITFNENIFNIQPPTLALSVDGKAHTSFNLAGKVLTINGLENGKTYTVEIVGAKDRAYNYADPIQLTVTPVAPGEAAKQDVEISASGNKVTLSFVNAVSAEKVSFNPNGTSSVTTLNGTDTTAIKYSTDKKTVTIDAQLHGVLGALNFLETEVTVDNLGTDIDAVKKTVTLTADKVAPKFVSSEAKTSAAKVKTLQLNFDKDVEVPASTTIALKVTHIDGVLQGSAATEILTIGRAEDAAGDVISTALVVTLSDNFKEEKSYTVVVAAGAVKDVYNNETAEFTTDFTVPKAGTAPVEPKANIKVGAPQVAGSKITLSFTTVDDKNLTDASALAVNFTLGGKALPAGTTVQFVDSKLKIEIVLPAGSIVTGGIRNLTLANIADVDGNTLEAGQEVKQVTLYENVPPTVKSVTTPASDTIVVTFSENVNSGSATGVTVKVNGAALKKNTVSQAISADKLTIKLDPEDALELTDSVSVEFKDSNITDIVGNKLADVVVSK